MLNSFLRFLLLSLILCSVSRFIWCQKQIEYSLSSGFSANEVLIDIDGNHRQAWYYCNNSPSLFLKANANYVNTLKSNLYVITGLAVDFTSSNYYNIVSTGSYSNHSGNSYLVPGMYSESIWLAVPVLLGFNLNQMYTLNIGVMPLVYVSGRNRYIGEYYLNTPMQNNYHILWNYLKAPVVFGMGAFCFNLRLLGKIGDKSWFFLNAECGKMYNFKYDLPSVFMYRASVGISYCVSFKK